MNKLRKWVYDKIYKLLLTDPRYKWLSGTATYDNPLGPVNPRSESKYRAVIASRDADIMMLQHTLKEWEEYAGKLKQEHLYLRALIDRMDRDKRVALNEEAL